MGQALVLFGLAAFLVGYGLFVLAESSQYGSESFFTYRRFAGVLAGFGLPALLYGLVISYSLGVMLCAFGVGGAAAYSDSRDGEDEFIWGNPPEI